MVSLLNVYKVKEPSYRYVLDVPCPMTNLFGERLKPRQLGAKVDRLITESLDIQIDHRHKPTDDSCARCGKSGVALYENAARAGQMLDFPCLLEANPRQVARYRGWRERE